MESLITPEEAAEYLRVTPSELKQWRADDVGPSYYEIVNHPRYRISDLDEYLESSKAQTFIMRMAQSTLIKP